MIYFGCQTVRVCWALQRHILYTFLYPSKRMYLRETLRQNGIKFIKAYRGVGLSYKIASSRIEWMEDPAARYPLFLGHYKAPCYE